MTIDQDIQFGDLAESEPATHLRPDANKHYAVAPVLSPRKGDLPIFVDLDAMRDMEAHALSDTRVELGGVLLGGQYRDREGQPFVLVTDSLRAQHYESTRGSFKFTHDTWSEITRARGEFPDDLQMVGWYHTHPDWGIFLSGMDEFICEHFFNKPLDVALVIDPCRQERGFFQWVEDATGRLQRTGGFHLVASRFRQAELEEYAAHLEGRLAMSGNPRVSHVSGPAPIIHVSRESPWPAVATFGLLAMQFCFLMLIAWRMLLPPEPSGVALSPAQAAALQTALETLASERQQQTDIDAKLEVLDKIVGQWDGTSQPLVQSLVAKSTETRELRNSLRAHEAQVQVLDQRIAALTQELQAAASREQALGKSLTSAQEKLTAQADQLAALRKELARLEQPDAPASVDGGLALAEHWKWIAGGVAAVAAVAVAVAYWLPRSPPREPKDSREPAE